MIDYEKLKKELDESLRPMYFFHDDPDGLASFLLCYKHVKEGVGVPVKTQPIIDMKFLPKVEYYGPDKIFVLDVANINQDFIDEVKVPVVWVDHHEPLERHKVKIFNPRVKHPSLYVPATYICYKTLKICEWLMIVGCLGDYYLPEEIKEFAEKNPDLITPEQAKDIVTAIFESKIGKLVDVFSFVLKGKMNDVKNCIKILTRINDAREILNQTTPAGAYIWKRYEHVNKEYMKLWHSASKIKPKKGIIFYTYAISIYSFTSNLAGDLMHKHPRDLIVVGREVEDEVRGSLRYIKGGLTKVLPAALHGVQGYGGGHDNASGFVVKKDDFNQFLDNLDREIHS